MAVTTVQTLPTGPMAGPSPASPTLDLVLEEWRSISGVHDLTPSSRIDTFADSLMMVHLSFAVRKALRKSIGVERLRSCETIADQAAMVDAWETPPPQRAMESVADVRTADPHVQQIVQEQLQKVGLGLDQIEDVVPLPDCDALMCRLLRPCSWNARFSYTSSAPVEQLEAAVRLALGLFPTFRSMAVDIQRVPHLVTLRHSEAWTKMCVTSGWSLCTIEDLKNLLLDDPILDVASPPGPLARFHVASFEDGTSGLVMVNSHVIQDGTSMKLWMGDIVAFLRSATTGITMSLSRLLPHASFADYARLLHRYRNGPEAQRGVQYWAERLKGIGALSEDAFWPERRAPEWFKGVETAWRHADGRLPRSGERKTVPDADKRRAQTGLSRVASLPDLLTLRSRHSIPVYILVEAAIALTNARRTHAREAIFCVLNAGRSWPFAVEYTPSERAIAQANPLEIPGCLFEQQLTRVPIDRSMSVLEFLRQMDRDEQSNNAFAHAPLFNTIERLRDPLSSDDSRSWTQRHNDAEAVVPTLRRQVFNWLGIAMPPNAAPKELLPVHSLTRADNGLTWYGVLGLDRKSVRLSMIWDAEHLSSDEAERAIDDTATLAALLCREANWNMSLGELLSQEHLEIVQ